MQTPDPVWAAILVELTTLKQILKDIADPPKPPKVDEDAPRLSARRVG